MVPTLGMGGICLLYTSEVAAGSPSNYRVELNVDDGSLLGWEYMERDIEELLSASPVEAVRYAVE